MHILVVEDEKKLATLLRRVLTEERHTVDVANDGTVGFDLAGSDTYDLVILDIMLPEMDGIEILTEMREAKIHTPVLMLTAKGTVEDRVLGLKAGADDYLVKPFAMAELLARVDALLRRRSHPLETSPNCGLATWRSISCVMRSSVATRSSSLPPKSSHCSNISCAIPARFSLEPRSSIMFGGTISMPFPMWSTLISTICATRLIGALTRP